MALLAFEDTSTSPVGWVPYSDAGKCESYARFGNGRQKRVRERWTTPKRSSCVCMRVRATIV